MKSTQSILLLFDATQSRLIVGNHHVIIVAHLAFATTIKVVKVFSLLLLSRLPPRSINKFMFAPPAAVFTTIFDEAEQIFIGFMQSIQSRWLMVFCFGFVLCFVSSLTTQRLLRLLENPKAAKNAFN
jgi:hypothetical protein